jgi:RHS repeat-associated protein
MTCSQNQNTQGPCPQYGFSSSTNQISNSGYAYDASGDLTSDGVHTYQYDAEGRLISVDSGTTASYVYNALGERVEKDAGGTYTEYVFDKDGNPQGENNRTSWTDTWVDFQGKHVVHYQNGEAYFMHDNRIGTTAFVTDYSGAVVQDELHYPWGEEWQESGSMEERYAGLQHRDPETGLDPTHYRMYSSSQYNWFTPDPLQADIFNPQSMSRYSYARGNPLNDIDPFGLRANPCYPQRVVYTFCTTSYNGLDSAGMALLNRAGLDSAYFDTPAPYLTLATIATGGFTFGSGYYAGVYEQMIGGGLGVGTSVLTVTGPPSAAKGASVASGLYNLGVGTATGNYAQIASGAAALMGEDDLSLAIDAGEDAIDALPAGGGGMVDELKDFFFYC